MAAYVYGDIEITDPAGYEEYRRLVPEIIARHGGKYLARGGAVSVLEGDIRPGRQVILEFPDMDQLLAFYHSPEYERLKAIRQQCSTGCLVAVEGV
jgi:uncharacterized protein (DUF1330 family)